MQGYGYQFFHKENSNQFHKYVIGVGTLSALFVDYTEAFVSSINAFNKRENAVALELAIVF